MPLARGEREPYTVTGHEPTGGTKAGKTEAHILTIGRSP
jgi:hypothetical protein